MEYEIKMRYDKIHYFIHVRVDDESQTNAYYASREKFDKINIGDTVKFKVDTFNPCKII